MKYFVPVLILSLALHSVSLAQRQDKHIEQKFVVLDVSRVTFNNMWNGLCQIDLQEDKIFGSKPIIYKASASSVICDFKKGKVVTLGINSPHCDMIWSEEHPPGSADQVACHTGRKWFVMTYTHFNEDNELVTSYWNYNYKKHTYKKDEQDPEGAPARHRARAIKSLIVRDCYPIQRDHMTDQQSNDCLAAVEKLIIEKAIQKKDPEICQQGELNKGIIPFDQTYAHCVVEVVTALGKPDLCEKLLYRDTGDSYVNIRFKECITKINDVKYCKSVPASKPRVKNLCYSAIGICDGVVGDFEQEECQRQKARSQKQKKQDS